jgi:hypothetical protein
MPSHSLFVREHLIRASCHKARLNPGSDPDVSVLESPVEIKTGPLCLIFVSIVLALEVRELIPPFILQLLLVSLQFPCRNELIPRPTRSLSESTCVIPQRFMNGGPSCSDQGELMDEYEVILLGNKDVIGEEVDRQVILTESIPQQVDLVLDLLPVDLGALPLCDLRDVVTSESKPPLDQAI